MKMRREQFSNITFQSQWPKFRWLLTFISLVYAISFPYYLSLNRQLSTIILSQPTTGRPIVDQLETLTVIFGVMFSFTVAMTIVAWHLWAVGRPNSLPNRNSLR